MACGVRLAADAEACGEGRGLKAHGREPLQSRYLRQALGLIELGVLVSTSTPNTIKLGQLTDAPRPQPGASAQAAHRASTGNTLNSLSQYRLRPKPPCISILLMLGL